MSDHINNFSRTRADYILRLSPYMMLSGAFVIGYRNSLRWFFGLPFHGNHGFSAYVYWINRINYFNSGFVRRGFGATILSFFDHGAAQVGMSWFALVCALFLFVPLGLFLLRLSRESRWESCWFAFILLASPQLFRWWGADPGHSDMMTSGFVAWALLAALGRRYALAVLTLLVGFLNHEAAVILGAPICAAFWFLDWREGKATFKQGAMAFTLLAAGLVVILALQHAFGADSRHIAKTIVSGATADPSPWLRSGSADPRLVAGYTTSGGLRGIVGSICTIAKPSGAYLLPLSCFFTLALYVIVYPLSSRVGILVFLAACLLPMTFLSVTSIDYGRWLAMSVMNGWLAAAALQIRGRESTPRAVRSYAMGGLALLVLVFFGACNPFASGMRVLHLGQQIYGHPLDDPSAYMAACDPQWKAVALGTVSAR